MASEITPSKTLSTTTSSSSLISDWLLKRLKPSNVPLALEMVEKNIKDLTPTEIMDLWACLVKPASSRLLAGDPKFTYAELDKALSTVDCIQLNSMTSISTSIGPLNASVIWDLAKPLPPSRYLL
ncbi:hypothetical protein [Simkania sp.]|uniref:hypothetical protein n=1 Tax=Simkania sp. TaxID=34094 RepID=UPI003B52D4E4